MRSRPWPRRKYVGSVSSSHQPRLIAAATAGRGRPNASARADARATAAQSVQTRGHEREPDRQRAHVVSTDGDAGRRGSEERVDVEHRAVRAGREGAMDVDLQTVPRTQADALAKATIEAGPRLVE